MGPRRKSNYRTGAPREPRVQAGSLGPAALRLAADAGMALLGAALLVGFFFLSRLILETVKSSQSFRLRTVIVEGNAKFSTEAVMALGQLDRGMSIFDVTPAAVETRIERNPWIKDARVKRVWPDAVAVTVRERSVAATVLVGEALYLVDPDGEIFEHHPEGKPLSTVLITGIEEEQVLSSRALVEEELRRILQFLDRYERMGLAAAASVGEIHRETGGGLVVYTRTEAREICFGKGQYIRKLKNLRLLLERLGKEKREWEYILLDSDSTPDRMIVKLR
jgi:hypothetical protein